MVRQVTLDVGYLYVVDVVVAQHLLGYFGTRQTAREHHLRILLEDRLQAGLYDITHHTDQDHQKIHAAR